jgi:hypothetical protein
LNQVPGPYTGTASFAGNAYYLPSSDSHGYTITHEETTLTYTGDPFIANNRPATLKAVLKEDGTVAPSPSGQTVTLTIGTGPTAQSCNGTTLSDGTVSCVITLVNQALGPIPVSAVFAGDAYYVGSSDTSQQRTVFAFQPGGGAFALGNCTAFTVGCATSASTSNLTWWSGQWASLNVLSGGSAPSSFKGFAAVAASGDPACGSTWSTATGNSAPPPGSVPTYTAMVVPSRVTQSGSTISGNIPAIVIVHTNPGYAANPGFPATGTIVGVLCHS